MGSLPEEFGLPQNELERRPCMSLRPVTLTRAFGYSHIGTQPRVKLGRRAASYSVISFLLSPRSLLEFVCDVSISVYQAPGRFLLVWK